MGLRLRWGRVESARKMISDAMIQRMIMNSARHGGLQGFRKLSSVLTIPSSG